MQIETLHTSNFFKQYSKVGSLKKLDYLQHLSYNAYFGEQNKRNISADIMEDSLFKEAETT